MKNCNFPILLIENDEIEVLTVQKAMTQRGISNPLIVFNCDRSGFDHLKDCNHLPSVILIDLASMTDDGTTFINNIKSEYRLKRIPIIALVSSNHDMSTWQKNETHSAGFMLKPRHYVEYEQMIGNIGRYCSLNHMSLTA